jgi:hypothetical protein
MKKFIIIALVVALSVLFILPASLFAHPQVPPQSIGKVSPNAVIGMHTAIYNVMEANGIAYHVFLYRFVHACHQ